MKTKCLTCERYLLPGESIKCEHCVDSGVPNVGFRTADVGDGNCDG